MAIPALVIPLAWVAGAGFTWLGLREVRKTGEAAISGVEALTEPIQETTNLAVVGVAALGLVVVYTIVKKKGKL